jgi:hypothetical protein
MAKQFALIHLPFAHCGNGSLSFFRFVDKEINIEIIRLQI